MSGHILVQPEALHAAAAELDAAAARLEASLSVNGVALKPPPSGADEVSLLAAGYFASLTDGFLPAAVASIAELHEAAATLRAQAEGYADGDRVFGQALATGGPQ
ncbi:PE family protein [Actinomycetes bacterium M1A6_2h]